VLRIDGHAPATLEMIRVVKGQKPQRDIHGTPAYDEA